MTIKTVIYNKRFSSSKVGLNGVIEIRYAPLEHSGQKECVTITYKNGEQNNIYDFDEVILHEPEIN